MEGLRTASFGGIFRLFLMAVAKRRGVSRCKHSNFFSLFYLILQRLPLPLTPSRAEGELVTIAWRGILIIGDGSQ